MNTNTTNPAETHRRNNRLRELARRRNRQYRRLSATCTHLTTTCRNLQTQVDRQESVIEFQRHLMDRTDDHDVFRRFFRMFVERTGPLFGVAMLCDENAELQLVGRFGVPAPDGVNFCQAIADAMVSDMLESPEVMALDAYENLSKFPPRLHKYLVGVNILVIPLMVDVGQLIGVVVLYRKGEQPFTDDDVALAEMIAPPTAAAAQRI